jgi:hypothetical protein
MLDAGDGGDTGDGGQAQAGKRREESPATAAALPLLNGDGDAVAMIKTGHKTRQKINKENLSAAAHLIH